jgi:hypothetical protein
VLDGIQEVRDRVISKLGVNSTPTYSSTAKSWSATDRSIAGQGDQPLSQGQIRIFWPAVGAARPAAGTAGEAVPM